MSRVEIPMPQMGESIAEGTLSAWLKRVGEAVVRDEPVIEISTDKVDAEIPSPAGGTLVEIVVAEGETVPVGTIVGYVETDPTIPRTGPDDHGGEGLSGTGAAVIRTASGPTSQSTDADALADRSDGSERSSFNATPDSEEARLRHHSSPLVRRMVEEHGLRLDEIKGRGRAGRVTKSDVLRHLASIRAAVPRAGAGADVGAGAGPVDGQGSSSPVAQFDWDTYNSVVVHPVVEAREDDRVEPMSRMTSLIADHMILSRRTAAHVHSCFEVDYTRIDQLRERNRGTWAEQGVRVNYTAFVALAAAQALREFPQLNASVSGDSIIYRGAINLGFAVALDQGLIVPVIRDADGLSLVELARAIQDIATRARDRRLAPEEVQGGTFTITNPGVFGTIVGFPILNQPQVGILGMGVVEKRAVVVDGERGDDAIVVRRRGFLSLGFDHRLVNGADADRFTGRIKQILESFQE